MIHKPHFHIITGGPGVGKTTLLLELRQQGFGYIPEVARQIIQEQVSQGGNATPWGDILAYTRLMLSRSIDSFQAHTHDDATLFFDRGIPDTLAYAHFTGQPIPAELHQATGDYRYNPRVFILPPWPEIYQTDSERKQTYQEAVDTHDMLVSTYQETGYRLTIVPRLPAAQRAEFILQALE